MADQTPVELYIGDEFTPWVETVTVNGAQLDYSTGYSFSLTITDTNRATLSGPHTTWTVGGTGGEVTTTFVGADLTTDGVTATTTAPTVRYLAFITITRDSDSADGPTIERPLIMRWRP